MLLNEKDLFHSRVSNFYKDCSIAVFMLVFLKLNLQKCTLDIIMLVDFLDLFKTIE